MVEIEEIQERNLSEQKPRVLIYGTGKHGPEAAQIANELGWHIVGAYNRAGDKVGNDVGLLNNGKAPIGVIVEDCDQVDFGQLDVDLAIVATTDRLADNWPVHERLLSAGVNVVCHGSEGYFPFGRNPEIAEKLDAVAKKNGVTFTGTGVWDHSRIWAGILAAGPCQTIKALHHRSRTRIDISPYTEMVGTGLTVTEFEETIVKNPGPLGGIYSTIPNICLLYTSDAADE